MKQNEDTEGNMEIMETERDEPYRSGMVQYIDSREVAEIVRKAHNELLKDIRRYCKQFSLGNIPQSDFFIESTYRTERGKDYPCYLVTKKGCEFIAHKLTGQRGTEFTARYINRFHDMEEQIREIPPQITAEEMEQIAEIAVEKIFQKGFRNGGVFQDSIPYDGMGGGSIEIRKKELYAITMKVADLFGESHSGILHQMYMALEQRLGIVLDAYKSVYRSETGRMDAGMVEVIAANDRLYEAAMDMNEYVIGKKQIYQ